MKHYWRVSIYAQHRHYNANSGCQIRVKLKKRAFAREDSCYYLINLIKETEG